MQVSTQAQEPLRALPELSPPPDLDANVLELSLEALDSSAREPETASLEPNPRVSRFENVVHCAIVAAYVVYAAHLAIGMFDRALSF
jgi:hypothetical protein